MVRCSVGIGAILLCLILGGRAAAHAQPDSVRAAILKEKGLSPEHSPREALWRAAAVPGWGQFYNRQYYKLPFVYAGLAGLAYTIFRMNQNYVLYRHAAVFARGQALQNRGRNIPNVISDWKAFRDDYRNVVREAGGNTENLENLPLGGSQLRRVRDKFRQRRDLSILGTGLFYALTILDAYVSAHLLAFDVGDKVALNVRPTGGAHAFLRGTGQRGLRDAYPPTTPGGPGLRVRVSF